MTTKLNLTDRAKNGRIGIQLVYVLECIKNSASATDQDMKFDNDKQVLQFFFDEFNEEFNYGYNKRRYPNFADRIGQYLAGLPSCCVVAYCRDEIITLGLFWGVLDQTEGRRAEKFTSNFFAMCGLRILQAAQKVGLNPYQWAV